MTGRIWLGSRGSEKLLPSLNRRYYEEDMEIAKTARTASGRLVTDVITVKKVIKIIYGTMKDSDLALLRQIYGFNGPMSLKVERSDGGINSYTVKMSPFSRQRLILATRWYWEGVTIQLEEI